MPHQPALVPHSCAPAPAAGGPRSGLTVCIGASAGGHLSQLLRLAPAWAGYRVIGVSTLELARPSLTAFGPVFVIGECNRHHPLRALAVVWRCVRIVRQYRPDVVVTTGSLPLAILCLVARLWRARIVWIDSVTNVTRLSMSGRLVRRFADLVLTQWPALAARYRRVEYAGALV